MKKANPRLIGLLLWVYSAAILNIASDILWIALIILSYRQKKFPLAKKLSEVYLISYALYSIFDLSLFPLLIIYPMKEIFPFQVGSLFLYFFNIINR